MLLNAIKKAVIWFLTSLIRVYQHTFSLFFPPSCRYTPTCSQYAIDALQKYGPIVGTLKAGKRILRCHPFSAHSSYDPA